MLSSSPLITFIPTRDAARARTFYEGLLGLTFVADDRFALVMDANGTILRITRVGEFTPFPFTILGWLVTDIETAVAALIAKGVRFSTYSFLKQDDLGIWTAPDGAKVAWFLDPDGNTLSLSQR
jgi:catechol 2,3-dioxygenase-like lactoylglutathione lyase family enzyme